MTNKKQKKIYIIIAVVVLAALLYWFYIRKQLGGMAAVDSADQQAYDQVYNYLSSQIDGPALDGWLSDIAKEFYTGQRQIDASYLVNGKINKTGALVAAWASSYYGNAGYKFNSDMNAINDAVYRIFYTYKNQYNKL